MGAAAEWISQWLSSVEHQHLIFPSDNMLNAVVDLHKLIKGDFAVPEISLVNFSKIEPGELRKQGER
jgi:hypothetical protein